MSYKIGWIVKNMGISRKSVLEYERKGFIKPIRNIDNMKYREFSEEELKQIWIIKLLVELGYSFKEISSFEENAENDFRESIEKKISLLEKRKHELELLIGHAELIKTTGIMPSLPKNMGSIKFYDFLEYSYKNWNVDVDQETKLMSEIVKKYIENPEYQISEREIMDLFENRLLKKSDEWDENDEKKIKEYLSIQIKLDSYHKELINLYKQPCSSPQVQSIVKKIYAFESEFLFPEYSKNVTIQSYVEKKMASFTESDMSILFEKEYGKEQCEFMAKAFKYFSEHQERNIENESI